MLSIRTQDRMSLVPYDTMLSIAHMIDSDYTVEVDYGGVKKNKWLGLYKTKERALEVLDEIENALVSDNIYDGGNNIILIPRRYQMPKE